MGIVFEERIDPTSPSNNRYYLPPKVFNAPDRTNPNVTFKSPTVAPAPSALYNVAKLSTVGALSSFAGDLVTKGAKSAFNSYFGMSYEDALSQYNNDRQNVESPIYEPSDSSSDGVTLISQLASNQNSLNQSLYGLLGYLSDSIINLTQVSAMGVSEVATSIDDLARVNALGFSELISNGQNAVSADLMTLSSQIDDKINATLDYVDNKYSSLDKQEGIINALDKTMKDMTKELKAVVTHLSSMVDISQTSLEIEGANADRYERIAQRADTAKLNDEYMQTELGFLDSEGVQLATGKPIELKAQATAQKIVELDAVNTMTYESSDFLDLPDKLPFLNFIGRSNIFDEDIPTPSSNPFWSPNS